MKRTDLAYVAGIIDGEGCIGLYSAQKKHSVELQVKVSHTNEWLTQWLKFAFGGSVRYEPRRVENCKPTWRWMIVADKAKDFLKLIYPYLRLKKPQAEIAIKVQEMRRGKRHHLTEQEQAVAEAQRIVMAGLNKRGVSNKL